MSTLTGGVILGLSGTFLPLTMFFGEHSLGVLAEEYASYAPWFLILTGVVKLLVTCDCIHSGWRGGHFFPVIFCGVSIGFGVAMICGMDPGFCVAVVTAALMGATMKQPLAVTVLLMLCFDIRIIPWILIASFVGSKIPVKKPVPAKD